MYGVRRALQGTAFFFAMQRHCLTSRDARSPAQAAAGRRVTGLVFPGYCDRFGLSSGCCISCPSWYFQPFLAPLFLSIVQGALTCIFTRSATSRICSVGPTQHSSSPATANPNTSTGRRRQEPGYKPSRPLAAVRSAPVQAGGAHCRAGGPAPEPDTGA